MNAAYQVEAVEEQITKPEAQEIQLSLSDLDLVGGGNACDLWI